MQSRRTFLAAGAASTLAGSASNASAAKAKLDLGADRHVYFTGDGIPLKPREWAAVLQQVTEENEIELDRYSVGGPIDELEARFAEKLGKEAAIFFGTGTLANQIAVRHITAPDTKVIVPRESHYYADSVNCGPVLSNLELIPMGKGRATFTLDEVQEEIEWNAGLRGNKPVGSIMIESPVRRKGRRSLRFHRDEEDLCLCPRARCSHPPRRRADVSGCGLFRSLGAGIRRSVRHALRLAAQVLQRRLWCGRGRPQEIHRADGRYAPDVRRRTAQGMDVRLRRAALHGGLRGPLPLRCQQHGKTLEETRHPSALPRRAYPERIEHRGPSREGRLEAARRQPARCRRDDLNRRSHKR